MQRHVIIRETAERRSYQDVFRRASVYCLNVVIQMLLVCRSDVVLSVMAAPVSARLLSRWCRYLHLPFDLISSMFKTLVLLSNL